MGVHPAEEYDVTGRTNPATPSQTARVQEALSEASTLASRIHSLEARLVGPEPDCCQTEKGPEPMGLFHILEQHARLVLGRISEAHHALDRIDEATR